MKKLITFLSLSLCMHAQKSLAQFGVQPPSFTTIEYIDVNNIKASALVHGDIWSISGNVFNGADSVPTNYAPACEFPAGSGKNVMFTGSLWMGGYDAGHTLHAAAQTYRQDGNDYWPGPLDGADTISYVNSEKWAKIWKINYADIQTFQATANHTIFNTPAVILQWPAKGNPYAKGNNNAALTINSDMAPFIDVNNDGLYNALQGDYPAMKGDQMLWWVYNDYCLPHSQTLLSALQVEVHATAYAYKRNTLIDNVIYYQSDIINRSQNTYDSFRIARFADEEIGIAFDDNIGFDSTYRMAIAYNYTDTDQVYGANTPVVGITFIHIPGDNGNTLQPIGNMMYYDNDFSVLGNISNGDQCMNYMRGRRLDDSVIDSEYTRLPFAECDPAHLHIGDKRIVMSTQDMTFAPGETKTLVEALVVTNPSPNNVCPTITIDGINEVADTAWGVYNNPPLPNYVNTYSTNTNIVLFPNPAASQTVVSHLDIGDNIFIHDMLGREVMNHPATSTNETVNITTLQTGNYLLQVFDKTGRKKANLKLVKL